jgi:hypothetical protein
MVSLADILITTEATAPGLTQIHHRTNEMAPSKNHRCQTKRLEFGRLIGYVHPLGLST